MSNRTHSVNFAGESNSGLFQQVIGQMISRCIDTGVVSKHQATVILEDMIQMIERGTLDTVIDNM